MLDDARLVSFVAVTDDVRALEFYRGTLGLTLVSNDKFALVFRVGDVELRLQKVLRFSAQPFTVLGWEVSDIQRIVRELSARGLRMQRYEFMKQDSDGIWLAPGGARIAWFQDPDGNILSVAEYPERAE